MRDLSAAAPRAADAAHTLPHRHPQGKRKPLVSNGLALCTLHHAAFDSQVVGIKPSLQVVVCQNVLEEEDSPMLRHGLQSFNGQTLLV
jgi:putative restriction endonuclease